MMAASLPAGRDSKLCGIALDKPLKKQFDDLKHMAAGFQ
jgi:hypothetical protein